MGNRFIAVLCGFETQDKIVKVSQCEATVCPPMSTCAPFRWRGDDIDGQSCHSGATLWQGRMSVQSRRASWPLYLHCNQERRGKTPPCLFSGGTSQTSGETVCVDRTLELYTAGNFGHQPRIAESPRIGLRDNGENLSGHGGSYSKYARGCAPSQAGR
jgi:hypothetical protein